MKLEKFEKVVFDLRSVGGSLDKRKILKKLGEDPESLNLFKIVVNPFIKFNISAKIIEATEKHIYPKGCPPIPESLRDLANILKKLSSREISGMNARQVCAHTIAKYPPFKNILLSIFDKDLKIGMGPTEINKVFPNFVPRFEPALATKTSDKSDPNLLESVLEKINSDFKNWTIQRKLDGVRVLLVCQNGTVTAYSRYGNLFTSLGKVCSAIKKLLPPDASFVLDGELCVVDGEGNENFTQAVSEIKRKDTEMDRPKFLAFDAIPLKDFENKKGSGDYRQRYMFLYKFLRHIESPYFELLPSYPYSDENFSKLMKISKDRGWEGLILKKNSPYQGGRTKNMYKVKNFEVEEFIVQSINTDIISLPDPETKIRRDEETMKSVNINYKGNQVTVGTGWSAEQRREFFKNPEKIIGRTISVQFQGESENKNNDSLSLRIPSLKYLWEDTRNA